MLISNSSWLCQIWVGLSFPLSRSVVSVSPSCPLPFLNPRSSLSLSLFVSTQADYSTLTQLMLITMVHWSVQGTACFRTLLFSETRWQNKQACVMSSQWMKQQERGQQHREHLSEDGLERNTQQINFSLSQWEREREGGMYEERWRAGGELDRGRDED